MSGSHPIYDSPEYAHLREEYDDLFGWLMLISVIASMSLISLLVIGIHFYGKSCQ